MKARVHIMLKNGVLDPQGEAVRHALATLGFEGVEGVRQGKVIELDLIETERAAAEKRVGEMCDHGYVTVNLALEIVTSLSSRGCLITSKTVLLNSGNSSKNNTPLCDNDISPGCG